MVGFTSLFRIPVSEPSLPHLVQEAEKICISGTLPAIDTLPDTPEQEYQTISAPLPVINSVPDILIFRTPPAKPPAFHPKQLTGFGNKKLHRCVLAQDGHSQGEEALYQILWKAGKTETEETRTIAMGYGEMSKRIRLSFNNTKATCRRLIHKLAIEEIAHEVSYERIGKTYRIFSYSVILERRRANDMEWVIKNKGLEFVIPSVIALADGAMSGTVPGLHISGSLPDTDTVSIPGRDSLSITGTLFDNSS